MLEFVELLWSKKVWVVCELPGWWPMGKANGEGDLVGEIAGSGNTCGEGVLANGDSGIWPHDFLLGERKVWTNLCFRPCKVDGLEKLGGLFELFAGELGTELVG